MSKSSMIDASTKVSLREDHGRDRTANLQAQRYALGDAKDDGGAERRLDCTGPFLKNLHGSGLFMQTRSRWALSCCTITPKKQNTFYGGS